MQWQLCATLYHYKCTVGRVMLKSSGIQLLPLASTGSGCKVVCASIMHKVVTDLLPWQSTAITSTTTTSSARESSDSSMKNPELVLCQKGMERDEQVPCGCVDLHRLPSTLVDGHDRLCPS